MIDALYNGGLNAISATWWAVMVWPVLWILIKIVAVSYTHLTLPTK
jgi:NADH-quinone oxidoreductase subunit H